VPEIQLDIGVSGIPRKVLTEHLFGLSVLLGPQERRAQRLACRIEPAGSTLATSTSADAVAFANWPAIIAVDDRKTFTDPLSFALSALARA
jgi:hypothetical protein